MINLGQLYSWMVSNHENHTLLDDMPVIEMFGGRVHKISNHVIHLMRGEYYTIAGRTFFTFGGGESTDKIYRKEGISWWPRELPSAEEIEHARATMNEHDNTVDYIITHVAPTSIQETVSQYDKPNILSEFFDEVYNAMSFKRWYCGHYHRDIIIKDEDNDKTIQVIYNALQSI